VTAFGLPLDNKESAMKPPRRRFLHLAAGMAALPAVARIAWAQSYPARPVRVIVPFAAGGPTDVCARLIAQKLSERLGRQFYVENVPGAGGNIGTGQAARAKADGYSILIAVNSHVINPVLYDQVPYDPFRDFEPVTLAAAFASAFAINPSVPASTVKELVAVIKASPGKYSFASPGLGTPSHLLGEQFRVTVGLDLVHVPFGGSAPAIASAVAGNTPIAFAALSVAAPLARDGKLRVLAVMSKVRSEALADAPTIAEAGYPGMDGDGWVGVLAPAGTPKDIVAMLQSEVAKIMAAPDVKERLAALGFSPVGNTSAEFEAQLKTEQEKWAKVIRAANLKVQ
jgi:tripartite-type tricarboxylate transporter receptor subunit TctC